MKLLITLFLIYSFTPFPAISPSTDSITVKGGLLTNNGTNQVESAPCANGEIIEWDSAQALGYKCVTKPADSNAGAINLTQSPSTGAAVAGPVTITSPAITTSGNPVRITLMGADDALGVGSQFYGTGAGSNIFKRNGVIISASTGLANRVPDVHIDSPAAGTYTYSIEVNDPQYLKLVVEEMGAATPPASANAAYALSASSGLHSVVQNNTVWQDIPNMSVNVTTTGGPVEASIVGDGATNGSSVRINISTGAFRIVRDSSVNLAFNYSLASDVQILNGIDVVGAGTYNYKVQAQCLASGCRSDVQYVKLFVKEIK